MELEMILFYNNDYEVLSWQNANMIHNWFKKRINTKGLKYTNSKSYDINYEDLKDLLKDVNMVLDTYELASEVLPQDLEYDRFYFETLRYTKKGLEKILNAYSSSDSFQYIVF